MKPLIFNNFEKAKEYCKLMLDRIVAATKEKNIR